MTYKSKEQRGLADADSKMQVSAFFIGSDCCFC